VARRALDQRLGVLTLTVVHRVLPLCSIRRRQNDKEHCHRCRVLAVLREHVLGLNRRGVIYHYPYWPPPLAATYVLLGILLQAWFCFGRTRVDGRPQALWPQVVTGILYAAAVLVFPGDIYQS
jgi:hypothetical protein